MYHSRMSSFSANMASKLMYMLSLVSIVQSSEMNCQNGERVSMTRISPYALEGYPTLFNCTVKVTPNSPEEEYLFLWHLGGQNNRSFTTKSPTDQLNITLYSNHSGSNLTCTIGSINENAACVINTETPHLPESITLDVNSTQSCDNGSLVCRAYVTVGQHYRVTCNVSRSYPESNIEWFLNSTTTDLGPTNSTTLLAEEDISQYKELGWKTSWVDLEIRHEHLNGIVICRVLQSFPDGKTVYKDTAMELVESYNMNQGGPELVVSLVFASLLAVSVTIVCALKWMRSRKQPTEGDTTSTDPDEEKDITHRPTRQDFSFPRSKIELHEVLGSGNFGQVYKATCDGILEKGVKSEAAVKILKKSATSDVVADFEKEIKIHKTVQKHPNVVSMLGYCMESAPFYLILEYLSGGNLQGYLRSKREEARRTEGSLAACPFQLLTFALEVANGMDYLSFMGCIHRDLASRNILLSGDMVCKLSDFGLARDVSETEQYEMTSLGLVPVRWLAIENLVENVYTTQSDVWSFGVLLWEIVTLGAHPYRGMSPNEIIDALLEGCRLPTPVHCSDKLYDIMKECWRLSSFQRPTFINLKKVLDAMIPDAEIYLEMDKFQADKYK